MKKLVNSYGIHWIIIVLVLFETIIIECNSLSSASELAEEGRDRQGRKFKKPLVFVTATQVTTIFQTTTSSRVGFCAKLVNVTGPCRRRRNRYQEEEWEDAPIVLTFDDGMDDIADGFLKPSPVFEIETTKLPGEERMRKERTDDTKASLDQQQMGVEVIQSTVAPPSETAGSKVFFHQVDQLLLNIPFRTITRVVLYTTTSTIFSYIDTSTKTFFIQFCTPSPMSYTLCSARRKR